MQTFLNGKVTLYGGDSRDVLRDMPDNSIDSVVCDPPYALVSVTSRYGKTGAKPCGAGTDGSFRRLSKGFMGKQWDTGDTAFAVEFWAQVMRVLKPGGHVVAFSGTRTYHRLAVAIEDAGFEIRDQLAWVYGSGFPKSHDVSKGIDKAAGAAREVTREAKSEVRPGEAISFDNRSSKDREKRDIPATEAARQWQGWGTALKPAWEPICLARKPLAGTVAANVLAHGTGALNIDGCRVEGVKPLMRAIDSDERNNPILHTRSATGTGEMTTVGRWPANLLHDGSDEVLAAFPDGLTSGTGAVKRETAEGHQANAYGKESRAAGTPMISHGDSGSAARFFYTAKADKLDRIGSKHPTVKPVDLMQWLCRLITPPGGVVLDPFAGSGSTGEAAWREGFRAVLIEREEEYQADIAARLELADKGPATRKARAIKQVANDNLPLFGGVETGGQRGEGRKIYGHFADQDGRNGGACHNTAGVSPSSSSVSTTKRSGRTIGPIGLKH